jgi:RNA ligase (TIGR02306 family)
VQHSAAQELVMSTFQAPVVRVHIEAHPDADALELAAVGGYRAVVRKGAFSEGQLVAYIPEQAILPEALIEELGLVGRLGGSAKNRVTPVRLRGVLSQGLVLAARPGWAEGEDVQGALGLQRYEPPIPVHMTGRVTGAYFENTLNYDIENIKRRPWLMEAGMEVVMTEKVHGSWTQITLLPAAHGDGEGGGRLLVSSKGLAAKGQAFLGDDPENADNLYVRAARAHQVIKRLHRVFGEREEPVHLLCEVFGQGVQDLHYGAKARSEEAPPGLRVFDLYLGRRDRGRFFDDAELEAILEQLGLPRVPVLYRGPFDQATLEALTEGKETVSGRALHLREGVVVRTRAERPHPRYGRLQFKSVSEAYLLRKGGTELQ